MKSIGNVKRYEAKVRRRVAVIRDRLRTNGPCHTDTADLCDYVEQLLMLYTAAQDVIADQFAQLRKVTP